MAWLVAVQAQEVARAKAALGRRARGLDDAAVERAFAAGEILRTHVLRPTWHFVAPADIRWLLKLTAPRVHQVNGS
ncbi:MAG: winged helix DNA-binding domain-containing protein, partial [Candidatus Promineofilum sp.]|nr:winged helix DNA-binding domain-containing protein [Promineifilum sp.]